MRKDQNYLVGEVQLRLPFDHALSRYQARFPTYDALLPLLAANLPKASLVIDIGANVGDTIAGMASANPELHFAAVEPSADFLPYLAANCDELERSYPSLKVEIVRAFISDDLPIGGLEGKAGTRRAVVGDPSRQTIQNITLDHLVEHFTGRAISLVKVDTDGFDWSVLASGRIFFEKERPLLFFETELGLSFEHFDRYVEEILYLARCGYRFTIFDNFGSPILEFQQAEVVRQMLLYLISSHANLSKTIYYYDILASTASTDALVRSTLDVWSHKFRRDHVNIRDMR